MWVCGKNRSHKSTTYSFSTHLAVSLLPAPPTASGPKSIENLKSQRLGPLALTDLPSVFSKIHLGPPYPLLSHRTLPSLSQHSLLDPSFQGAPGLFTKPASHPSSCKPFSGFPSLSRCPSLYSESPSPLQKALKLMSPLAGL